MALNKIGELIAINDVDLDKSEIELVNKKQKRKILDEDDYIEKLEAIIERDFFPDLAKLKQTLAYQNAIESNDFEKLNQLRVLLMKTNKTTTESSRQCSPNGFETPAETERTSDVARNVQKNDQQAQKKDKFENLTLNKFLAKYTSEDNLSFETIIEEAKRRHREKYPWLYIDEQTEKKRLQASLTLPSQQNAIESASDIAAKSSIQDSSKNPPMLTWTYKNKNSVMYYPDGCEFSKTELIERKKLKPEVIMHENTRFTQNPFIRQSSSNVAATSSTGAANNFDPTLPKKIFTKIGIDGKELEPNDGVSVNGYNLVSMSPSPAANIINTPLMTWGCIESTPYRLDGNCTPLPSGTPQFRIPEQPKREQLAHSLSDKFNKQSQLQKKKNQSASSNAASPWTPTFAQSPRTPSERLNLLSPAARKLVGSNFGLTADKKLRESYSPSPHRTAKSSERSKASDFF